MIILLSPAKSLDFENTPKISSHTKPRFLKRSEKLIQTLKQLSKKDIANLMSLSDKLSELNLNRYQNFKTPFNTKNAKQAIYAFQGDVYQGLEADKLTEKQMEYAQEHLRILSGLYGVLRPLDLIQPYRLEMGTKLKNPKGKNLYEYWSLELTESLNKELAQQQSKTVVNLASNEYFKSVQPQSLNANIITPQFKDYKNGEYKIISFYAKKARGMMAAYIIKNKAEALKKIQKFDVAGYEFSKEHTVKESDPVFIRRSSIPST